MTTTLLISLTNFSSANLRAFSRSLTGVSAARTAEGGYTLQGNKPDVGRRTYLVGFSEKDDAESFVPGGDAVPTGLTPISAGTILEGAADRLGLLS